MIEFLSAGPVLPFSVALAVMGVLTVIEALGFIIGHGASQWFEGFFDSHGDGADGQVDVGHSAFDRMLGWMYFGDLPMLVVLVVLLASFGSIGLGVQYAMVRVTGQLLPGFIVAPIALLASLPVLRVTGGILRKALPRDETTVVSQQALIGRAAVIVLGEARVGSPAQARLKDQHGQSHYVMVEPDQPEECFTAGQSVILIEQVGARYRAIRNDVSALGR